MLMAALAGNNPANDPDRKPVKSRSRFKPNRSLYQTMLFGLNTPHFAMEAVEGDSVSVRVASDVDTFSLKAPLMSPVRMHKDYFFAPLRSILPKNAELLITNPLTGEDIEPFNVNCGLTRGQIYNYINYVLPEVRNALTNASNAASLRDADLHLLRALVIAVQFLEPIVSDGCLLNVLGHSTGRSIQSAVFANGKFRYFDFFIETLCNRLKADIQEFSFDYRILTQSGNTWNYTTSQSVSVFMDMESADSIQGIWSFRQFLEFLRQGHLIHSITIASTDGLRPDADTSQRGLVYDNGDGTGVNHSFNLRIQYSNSDLFVNFSRLVAYQLSCAQFYTEDSVDYVYSTKLWHENQMALARIWSAGSSAPTPGSFFYMLNGTQQEYDSVSSKVIQTVMYTYNLSSALAGPAYTAGSNTITVYSTSSTYRVAVIGALGYINNLFCHSRSLKFRDYFCGSKTQPLAVGNVNVPVSGGSFNVVDVTKNIQLQRFLNQVNRVGRKFNEYVQGIFGTRPMTDPHEVIFLGKSMDVIGAEETQNTGAAQLTDPQTITSKLRKNSSQFAFEGSFSEPGILIGITHFEVVRPYVDVTDRQMFHVDRFDMFNPFMQHIGDQPVYIDEIDPYSSVTTPFGYQLRYMEYRQAVDRAVGGFREFLPGYAFVNHDGFYKTGSASLVISPDFIRARPCEFDRFYVALPNHSLAGYFHFIIRQDISVDASRPMEAAPSIL